MPLTRNQRLARRDGIGSSDVAAIVGMSPFMGPHDVYLAKVPPYAEVEETDPMRAGTFLEKGIADWLAAERRLRLVRRPTYVHPRWPWALANLDRVAVEGRGEHKRDVLNVEIKNVSGAKSATAWGEDSDAVPEHVFLQTTWQMAVSGLRHTLVAACFFGRNLRVYEIAYDEGLGGELLEAARAFWEGHVIPRVPPPLDGSESCGQSLRARFPVSTDEIRTGTPEDLRWARQWIEADADLGALERLKREAQNQLCLSIGDAAGIKGSWGQATWKPASGRIDWEAAARAAGVTDESAEAYRKPGARRFRLTASKE